MVANQDFIKFGFVRKNINMYLNKTENDIKLKEIHIEMYPENPFNSSNCFMLMLRTSEKNAIVSTEDDRIILKKNDAHKTHIANVLTSKVIDCYHKKYRGLYDEFILNIQNIWYKITILN